MTVISLNARPFAVYIACAPLKKKKTTATTTKKNKTKQNKKDNKKENLNSTINAAVLYKQTIANEFRIPRFVS